MSKLRALIVGASIAGPTTAYWLAKAGATVTVIERFPKLRTNGQNIDIRTAGVTVMRKMPGLEATVRAKTTTEQGINLVRANGRPNGIIRATGNPDRQSLVSEYEIFRGDLSRILVDLTRDNESIRYVFGEQVASMRQSSRADDDDDNGGGGPITVEFANGLPAAEYDLVVACDGATSRTRATGFDCGVRDHVEPANCWAAYFSLEQDLLEGSKVGQGYSAVGGRFYSVGPDPSGVSSHVMLMGIHPRGDRDRDAARPFREALRQGDHALKRFISQRYRGAGWKADALVDGMMNAADFYASEIVQVKMPRLYKGRLVLFGDAGYAPGFTGGGTTLALAGAYCLAGEVGKHKGDLAAGLRGYEERMRPLIEELQKVPPFVPQVLAPQTAWGLWLRNYVFAFVAWSRILEVAQRFFAGAFACSDKFPLPDYDWVA